MQSSHEPAEVIERVATPRGELQLQRRGAAYEVIFNGSFLMATYNGESEGALIRLAGRWVPNPRRILVGGLGVGYTLRAALDCPGVERVTVVEIEPKVVEWNRTHLAPFHGWALADPRTELVVADLAAFLAHGAADSYDLIALDTDNGPDWIVFAENAVLWGPVGLAHLSRLLAPGGVLAFWSASASPEFAALLQSRYREVLAIPVAAAVCEADDLVYLAR